MYCKDGIDLIKVLDCKKEKGCLKSTNASEREVKDSSELFELAGKNKLDVVIDLAPFGNPVTGKILQSALSNGIDCVLANKAPLVNAFHVLKKLAKTSGAKFAYVVQETNNDTVKREKHARDPAAFKRKWNALQRRIESLPTDLETYDLYVCVCSSRI